MLAMISLWTLSVLLLLHDGAQGARMVTGRELPPCKFHWQVPGWDCNVDSPQLVGAESNLEVLPPCEFKYQRVGVDCWPWWPKTSTSPAAATDVPTPVTKISWLHCLKCMEILFTCGCIIGELLIGVSTSTTHQNMTQSVVTALDFYNVDTSVPPYFSGVTIEADHETPTETKTMRVWKSGTKLAHPTNAHPAINLSSLAACDPLKCIDTLHNCWKCLGHGDRPPPPASAAYNFHSGLAPFYDVAVLAEHETKTVRVWKMDGYDVQAQPVGNWRANFSLAGHTHLEISFTIPASESP